ncbi:flagellar hook-length control protein FliK [Blastococcus sp. TF02A-35]|uniref:flagellar hook-length control protein FliK n=1 Tax=Blastococcus sp. TF02A-35 TaxID=2559612 RepID=UPI00107323F2|nr:flagellar hook-length control protein FliK [Blastococcus sp. TF02A_35]TFV52940.1 flagellar hook-length control protein FliK [Blastococcus sp. TF02A_35]
MAPAVVPAGTAPDAAGLTVLAQASAVPGGTTTTSAPAPGAPAGTADGAAPVLPTTVLPPARAGAGDTGAGPGGEGASRGETASVPSAGTDPAAGADTFVAPTTGSAPAATVAPAASVAATEGATGADATLPVSGQVARQVAVLSASGNGVHTMTLVLNPENLGPVEVQVTVAQGSLDLHLRGAHEQGRLALLDALPELRRDLESAGLSPSRVEVDADAGGSWLAKHAAEQQAHQQSQQHGSGGRGAENQAGERSRSWGLPADSGEGRPQPSQRSTSSGVDVRV